MKKTLLALSILAAGMTAANAAELYNQDGTSFSIDGDVTANFLTGGNKGPVDRPYGQSGNVQSVGTSGQVNDTSWFNLKPTGKSYFNGQDGWYGIGHAYIRFTEDGTQVREIWAGLGNDTYGQLVYGRGYTPWNLASSSFDLGLNFSGYSYQGALPGFINLRDSNMFKYDGTFGNLTVMTSASVGNKKGQLTYSTNAANGTGSNGNVQFGGNYKFDDSGYTLAFGGYYADFKVKEASGFNAGTGEATGLKAGTNDLNLAGGTLGLNYQGDHFGYTAQVYAGKGVTSGTSTFDGYNDGAFGADGLDYQNDSSKLTNKDGDYNFLPVAKANFVSYLANVSYQVDKMVYVIQYEGGRFTSIDTAALGPNYTGGSSETFANELTANINYLWNKQFSTGLEYTYDLQKSDSPYYYGNGLYAQASYAF